MNIGVIGLGYVGLTAAVGISSYGHNVYGYDKNPQRILDINRFNVNYPGDSQLFDVMRRVITFNSLKVSSRLTDVWNILDAVLVCVGVNVSKGGIPDYDHLLDALNTVAQNVNPGAVIIIETTLPVGTMNKIVVPLLGDRYELAYCPERVTPGKLLWNFYNMHRAVGVADDIDQQTEDIIAGVYAPLAEWTFIDGVHTFPELHLCSYVEAEITKLGENAYRDVMIAFSNTLALTCEQYGGDVYKVKELIDSIGDRTLMLPGAGVGGYCLQKDTRLLAYDNLNAGLLNSAYHLNEWMPWNVAGIAAERGIRKALILGVAYKEGVEDARNSPAYQVGTALQMYGAKVVYHDPFVDKHCGDVYAKARNCGAVILVTGHKQYKDIDFSKLQVSTKHATPLFIDCRGMIKERNMKGWIYHCLGVGGAYGRQ